MAVALVGSLGALSSTISAGSLSPAFGQTTTAGNLLVAWCYGSDTNSKTINQGWTFLSTSTAPKNFAYKANCAAGETAPTYTFTAGSVGGIALAEFSGCATSSPFDKTGTGTGGASPVTGTASGADSASGELVLAIVISNLSKSGTDTTAVSAMANISTIVAAGNNDATSAASHLRFAYGITTGNSAADSATGTSTSMNLSSVDVSVVSFKLSAATYGIVFNDRQIRRNTLLRR